MENRENKKPNVRERETGRGRNKMYMEAHVLKHEKYTVTGYFDYCSTLFCNWFEEKEDSDTIKIYPIRQWTGEKVPREEHKSLSAVSL